MGEPPCATQMPMGMRGPLGSQDWWLHKEKSLEIHLGYRNCSTRKNGKRQPFRCLRDREESPKGLHNIFQCQKCGRLSTQVPRSKNYRIIYISSRQFQSFQWFDSVRVTAQNTGCFLNFQGSKCHYVDNSGKC